MRALAHNCGCMIPKCPADVFESPIMAQIATTTWASGVSIETGRPIAIPEARYDLTGQGKLVAPPEATAAPELLAQEGFDAVVLGRVLSARGMAPFDEVLDAPDTVTIRAYLVARANDLLTAETAAAVQLLMKKTILAAIITSRLSTAKASASLSSCSPSWLSVLLC
jgi:hypothetical protein